MDFINLKKQYQVISENVNKDILNILDRCDFVLGEEVFELEKCLASYVGVSECITCASGTDALLIPLMAYNIGKGDAVFTTNFSYFATTEVISLVGAHPIFVDIEEDSFNLDPTNLEKEIVKILNEGNLLPKAIIAVDLFGQLANYQKIQKIAKKYNLILIEDAAQSFGASHNNQKSCSFGDISATSFYPSKPLGCYGDGGAIFTNDKKIAELCKSIRVHGQGADKYDNIRIGLNSRLDTIQAAILLNKLKIFDKEIKIRNKIANYYSEHLKKYLIVPKISNGNISSWAQYSLLTESNKEREDLVKYLKEKDIPIAIFYKKIFSEISVYKEDNAFNNYDKSKNISNLIFSLPMNAYLEQNEQDYIIESIEKFYK